MRRMFSEKQIEKLAVDGIKEQLNSDDGFENEFPEFDTRLNIDTNRFDYGNDETFIYCGPDENIVDIQGNYIHLMTPGLNSKIDINGEDDIIGIRALEDMILSTSYGHISLNADGITLIDENDVFINNDEESGDVHIGSQENNIVEIEGLKSVKSTSTLANWAYVKTHTEFEIWYQAGETILTINVLSSQNYDFQIGLSDVQNDYPDVTQLAINFDGTIYGPTLVGWLKYMTPIVIDSEETTLRSALNTGIFGYVCNRVFCEGI